MQNAFRLDYATKQKAVASIRLKDRGSAGDVKRLTIVFMTQVRGGTRADKKSESALKNTTPCPVIKTWCQCGPLAQSLRQYHQKHDDQNICQCRRQPNWPWL
ncbi:hypothetical protein THIOSC15_3450007 [uncultured Thiomicrorhabdus sp.]